MRLLAHLPIASRKGSDSVSGFEISSFMLDDLGRLVRSYAEEAVEAGEAGREAALGVVQDLARSNPRWIGLADNIDTWDEEDRFWIGVRGPNFVSEAFAAEYGTDDYPPAPLFRLNDAAARAASFAADQYLHNRFVGGGAIL